MQTSYALMRDHNSPYSVCYAVVAHRASVAAFAAAILCWSIACAQRPTKSPGQSSGTIARGSATSGADSTEAVRRFVQDFYDWYTPFVVSDPRYPAWWKVLSSRSDDLSAPLAAALRDDSISYYSDTRESVEFDPFLESQDPCSRYAVTDVRSSKSDYRVTMRPVCSNSVAQQYATARPVVLVAGEGNRWKIANVFYEKGDLKSLLCGVAMADTKPERRPSKCE